VSGYEDWVKAGTRLKNQRYALLRGCGKTGFEKIGTHLGSPGDPFVRECFDRQIEAHKEAFKSLAWKYPEIRHQMSLPGIGVIHAVKIVARVVSPYRFADKGHYLSYSGRIKREKISGGRSDGKRNPRYCRQLKGVYKSGVLASIGGSNLAGKIIGQG
jgi:transposase